MATHARVRKAVIPAAGLGTRFLPATKAQPKEMLPIVDKPLIQYAVEECVASGIEHIIIVNGKGKNSIEDHFDLSDDLERFLLEKGKKTEAALVRNIGEMAQISYTRQKQPLGLGHAVLVTRELVGDEPFAVLLGDVIFPGKHPATRQLIEVFEATGIGAIAVEEVPPEQTQLYGIADTKPGNDARWGERLLAIRDLVEKPQAFGGPFQPSRDWALRPSARDIRISRKDRGRSWWRDSAYGRFAGAGQRAGPMGLPLRRQDVRCRRQTGLLEGYRRNCIGK